MAVYYKDRRVRKMRSETKGQRKFIRLTLAQPEGEGKAGNDVVYVTQAEWDKYSRKTAEA